MRIPAIAAIGLLLAAGTSGAVDITACGQTIEAGQFGALRQNLTCSNGVLLSPGATLYLNGFVLRGSGLGSGVMCQGPGVKRRPCTIAGPGEIRGFWAAVNCGGCRIVARDLTIRANVNGIYAPLSATLEASRLVVVDNVEDGIFAFTVRAADLQASGNGGAGVAALGRLGVRRLEASGNGGAGVRGGSRQARVVDSNVTGNGLAADGYDITSSRNVRLVRTTCGRSAKLRYARDGSDEFEVIGSFGCAGD